MQGFWVWPEPPKRHHIVGDATSRYAKSAKSVGYDHRLQFTNCNLMPQHQKGHFEHGECSNTKRSLIPNREADQLMGVDSMDKNMGQ